MALAWFFACVARRASVSQCLALAHVMARRSAALVCLLLVCLVGLASATVYFKETFDGTSVGFIGWLWHACKCEGGGFFCPVVW